jgi:hypothetical protein
MIHLSAWRRVGALALVLALGASLPALVQAAPAVPYTSGSHADPATRLLGTPLHTLRHLRGLNVHALRPLLRTAALAQAVTDPTKLAFTPPSNAVQPQAGTVDTAFANDPTKNVFASFNATAYDVSGMQSGYAEFFSLPIGSGTDQVDVEYLATIYGSADQATARVNGTVQFFTGKGISNQSCGTGCFLYGVQFTPQNQPAISLVYVVFSNDNVVGELGFVVNSDVLNANNTAFTNLVTSVSTLAFNAVLGPANLSILDFEVVHTVKGKAKITHKLKSGEAGVFIADLQLPNANDTIQAQVTFTVGKKTVGPLLLGNPQTASDGSVLVGAKHKFKVKKTTTVVAHLQVQDGSAQATKDLTFKVTH